MVILGMVLCFVNGAVLAGLSVLVFCRGGIVLKRQEEQVCKADPRIAKQWGNLLGYNGSEFGQREVNAEE